MQYQMLADDQLATTTTTPTTALESCGGYSNQIDTADHGNNIMVLGSESMRDGSLDALASDMSSKARSPLAIGCGLGAAAYAGYKLYPRAVRRYGKSTKSKVLTGAGAVVAGVLAHGLSSYILLKFG